MRHSTYTGKEVCQGCKIPGNVKSRRRKDSLCDDCKSLIEAGIEAGRLKDNGNRIEVGKADSFFTGASLTMYDGSFHEYTGKGPYIAPNHRDQDYTGDDQMKNSLNDLLISMESDSGKVIGAINFPDGRHRKFILKDTTAKALFSFIKTTLKWGRNAEKRGFTEGTNLLQGLNTGKITLEEFDKRISTNNKY